MKNIKKIRDVAKLVHEFYYTYNIGFDSIVSPDRLMVIIECLEAVKEQIKEGHILAEVGVYRGGTARFINNYLARNDLLVDFHIVDTFEGMPETDKKVDDHNKGDFRDTSLEMVSSYFHRFENVKVHKAKVGPFPDPMKDEKYSFVHLDVDIYQSYVDCLKFFHYKMAKGGIILCDDYNFDSCRGAKKAIDEFYLNEKNDVVLLKTNQALIYYGE